MPDQIIENDLQRGEFAATPLEDLIPPVVRPRPRAGAKIEAR